MKRIFTLFIFLSLISNGLSQQFNFRNFNLEDGLPQNSVYNIFQDNNGYIWLGTQGGVAIFDGIQFKNFDQKDGISGNHVTKICQDKNNNIWLGHRFEGFSCIVNEKITKLNPIESKYNLIAISAWKDGIVSIIQSEDSVSSSQYSILYLNHKNDKVQCSNLDIGTFTNIYQIKSKDKELYLATNNGIQIFNADLALKNEILINEQVVDFDWDANGSLYVLTNKSIKILNDLKTDHEIIINEKYNQLLACKSGQIWICNDKGALSIIGDKKQIINTKNGLPTSDIYCVTEDNEGNIWFGLHGKGLSQLVPANFESFDESQGLKNDQISSICMDHLSRLWFVTQNTIEILEFHKNSNFSLKNVIHFSDLVNIEAEEFNFIFQDSRSMMWIGTDNGAYVIDTAFNVIKHFSTNDGLLNNFIISIDEDLDNNIWLASLRHGVTKISPQKNYSIEVFDKKNGLCSNSFWTVFVDSQGKVYFGSNDAGITYWNGSDFKHINETHGLSNLRAGSITEDTQSNIWIGSIGGGIFKYNGDTCVQFSSKNGLSSDNPYLVLADDLGNIWTGTNTGLDMMSITKNPNHSNENLFKHYGLNQGFLGIECNQNAKFKDAKGNLWFGTVKGVVQCNSKNISEDTTPPKLHINEKKLFLRESIDGTKSKFNYNENHITFNFIGLHYTNPHQVKYQYKLDNFDNGWSPWTKNTTATYSYLPPGKYIFKLKAANGDDYESETISYEFEITPPFWNTIWFYSACALSILLIFIVIMRIRTLKIQKDKRLLENKVELRTKELNKEKEIVENQKEVIEIKNKNITDSILYAKTIQESVLPNEEILSNYFTDHFIFYEPRDIVSGDFYWFKQNKEHIILAAADCTGHGIPGAFLSMLGSELLNQIVLDPETKSPAKAIKLLDDGIYNAMYKDKDTIKHNGIDISICVFNKNEKSFQYSGARRPIIVLNNNEIHVYNPLQSSIGEIGIRNEEPYEINIPYGSGDRVYMFSDGFTDQFGGPKNKKFLIRRFQEKILELAKIPLNEQEKIFRDTFAEWKGKNEQIDDILIMAIEL